MIGIFLPNMRNAHQLSLFLGEEVLLNPKPWNARQLRAIALWGHSWRSWPGRIYAWVFGLPILRIEDGFIRSVGAPPHKQPHLSVIKDTQGIFYDARCPTDLEDLIQSLSLTQEQQHEAAALLKIIRDNQLNKYNTSVLYPLLKKTQTKRVLVIDQTWRDDAIRMGLATTQTFTEMLKTAHDENPDADLFLKPHPSTLSGRRWGNINLSYAESLGFTILKDPCNALSLLEHFDHIYVVTSLMGFEALMMGKKVTCFGVPFYAGWGLTDDRQPCPRRTARPTFLDLFYAAYMVYPTYVLPGGKHPSTLKETIDYIISRRDTTDNVPSDTVSTAVSRVSDSSKSRRKSTNR